MYIKKYSSQDMKRNLAKVFVAHNAQDMNVMGYYTLSPSTFCKQELSLDLQRKLPSYPIPAVLVGRLAVDISFQKEGIGSHLLMDALSKIHNASETVLGIFAVVVEAKDDTAASFYKHLGFIPFRDTPRKLFLPMKTIQELMG